MTQGTEYEQVLCATCGAALAEYARYCAHCGAEVVPIPTQCPVCATPVTPDNKFCPRCGHDLSRPAPPQAHPGWFALALGSIAGAATLTSIFTPDLVSGFAQDRVPLAVPVSLFWAAVTIVVVAAVTRAQVSRELALSIAAIWVAAAFISVFSPELVSGSDPTKLPIAMLIAMLSASVATVLLVALCRTSVGLWGLISVVIVWGAAVLVAVLTPTLETGSDPTEVPLAAMISPILAAVATPLVCVFTRADEPPYA